MKKRLTKVVDDGTKFVNGEKKEVNPVPIGEPLSIRLGFEESLSHKRIEETINYFIPKTSKLHLEANAYCVGTRTNNDNGSPVQFYKI